MTPLPTPSRPRATRSGSSRIAPLLVVLVAALLAVAPAQTLPELLPEGAAVAFGLHDLDGQIDRLQPFLDEAERLGLADSVGNAVPDEDVGDALPAALADLGVLDLVGEEAWFVVTASAFQPLPAATVIAQVGDDAATALRTVIQDAAAQPGVERLEESGRTLWTYVPPADADEDALPLPVGYALTDDGVAVASTDPEVVRFALRALGGADEPSMADGALYADLSALGEGHALFMADLLPLTRSLEGLAAGFEAGPLLARLQDALATAGPTVGLTRITADGLEATTLQRPDPSGPDTALYALLTEGTAPAPAAALAFTPADATTVAANTVNAAGWWAWLDDVLASAASLGVPPASELAMMFGLDVQTMLFSWMGDGVVQVHPAVPTDVEQGPLQAGASGTQAFLLESTDDAAARQGLDALLQTAAASFGAFAAPEGGTMPMPETVEVAGQEVRRLTLQEGFAVDTAVVDGWALLSSSPEITEAVLAAHAGGGAAPSSFEGVVADLPANARAWSVADVRASLLGASGALVTQLQTAAGLGGATGLDFDEVDEAGADLAAFIEFAAERMGTSHTATVLEDGELRGGGFSEVAW